MYQKSTKVAEPAKKISDTITRITSVAQLQRYAKKDGGQDFFIHLNGGLRSSKHISYDGEKFYVLNEIDA